MADIQVANTDSDLSGNTLVTEENAYTITGLHTFSRSTNAPFAVVSGAAVVANLDADELDGQHGSYYLAAANFTGTLAVANGGTGATSLTDGGVLLGSGTGAITATAVLGDGEILIGDGSGDPSVLDVGSSSAITILGTVATGVWQGTTVAVGYGGTGATSLTDGGVLLGSGSGAITAMSVLTDGQMIVGDGSGDPVAESGATLRTSIGVGTGDSPTFTAVTVGQVDITAEGDLRLQDASGGEYVGFDAPATVSSSYTLTLPAAIGSVNQVLSINNTDGTLQWATPETGDITSVVAGAGMTGGGSSGDVTLNVIGTTDKIDVSSDAITIASGYTGQTSITTLGTIATGTWEGTDVGVAHGGTGASSLTDGGVLLGSGTGAITAMSVLTDGQMIVGDGSGDPVAESGATLRTSIGVGTTDTPEWAKIMVGSGGDFANGLLNVECDSGISAAFIHQDTSGEVNTILRGGNDGSTVCLSIQNSSGVQKAAITNDGTLSKTSGSFRIPHPHPSKADTHDLVHSFVESNRAGLVYDGEVDLVAGAATIDMDELVGMTSGTWVLLTRDPHVFTSNETGWSPVRGTVSGATLTIECQDNTSTDTVSFMVVAERQDAHMTSADTEWTDDEGRPIIEPLQEVVE